MKIIFDASVCGLGNNGGSQTVVKSVKILREFGVNAMIYTNLNKFTWESSQEFLIDQIEDCDRLVYVSRSDFMDSHNIIDPKKSVYWARGIETWQYPDSIFIPALRDRLDLGMRLVCNSQGLAEYYRAFKIESSVCYAGIDSNIFCDKEGERGKIIGCTYTPKPSKNFNDFLNLLPLLPEYNFLSYGIPLFSHRNISFCYNPDLQTKQRLYHAAKYWLCPTISEGFHNVGIEALMSGCILIRRDNKNCGMLDYSNEKNSIIYKNVEEIPTLMDKFKPQLYKIDLQNRYENMKRFIDVLSK
jgi:hypothetical protein